MITPTRSTELLDVRAEDLSIDDLIRLANDDNSIFNNSINELHDDSFRKLVYR